MIRPALPKDSNAVAAILIASRLTYLPYAPSAHSEEHIRDWVESKLIPGGRVLVWEEGREIVAMVATSEEAGCGWLDQLYVMPGWTSRGIGSRLLRHAHGLLSRPIRLYTFQQNIGARRFYEANGYKAIVFSDGQENEEKCPDVLYELTACGTAA